MAVETESVEQKVESQPAPPVVQNSKSHQSLVLTTIMISTFMAVLDATIVNVALAKLTVAFGTSTDLVAWVLTGYMLAFAVMLPTSAWIADRFGYKATYIAGVVIFTFGSFLCSISWNIVSLIIFRVVQGVGGGLVQPVGMAIVTREFPPERRGMALGFYGIAASASIALGPTLGGYLIDNFSWQMIFDVNVPVGVAGVIMAYIVLHEHRNEHRPPLDAVGFLGMSIFLTGVLLGLAEGNASWNTDGWGSTFEVVCFSLGAAGLVAYVLSAFFGKHPLIDLRLFKDWDFALSNVVLFVFGLGMFGSVFLLPLYLQNSLGYTPLQTGLLFLPMGLMTAVFAPISGILTDKVGARVPLAIGMTLLALSMFQYRTLSLLSEGLDILVPLYIRGIGMGLVFTPISAVALSQIPRAKMGQASGIINVVRQIGGSFGVALFGTMLLREQALYSNTFGEAMSRFSPAFRNAVAGLAHFAQRATGGTYTSAVNKAQAVLIGNMETQAFIASIDKIFLVASMIIVATVIPVLLLKETHRSTPKTGAPPVMD
ncbi:MAG TPA: DHA2 family efflux MFS transporter permease subunit [Spirochaetia bacterium]|nr:DHA2 family efflux MFS transporter permease subunit [Spirochaetia bacterium]